MTDIKARITDAEGHAKVFRNAAHAWGARNPFSFGTITLVVGLLIGAIWL